MAGAVALGLVLEWYGATSEVSWLFLLAAWMLALAVASAGYAAWNRGGIRLTLTARGGAPGPGSPLQDIDERIVRTAPQQPPLFESDAAELEIALISARGSRGPAWVTGEVSHRSVTLGTGVVPAAGWRRVEAIHAMPRGPVDAKRWTVRTSDPLGFFAGRRDQPDAEVAVVYPRFASLSGLRQTRELEASVAAPRAGAGNELFGIREYRSGDSLRRIHWRSSARRGELVVREYEPPGVQTLGIFLDPRPPDRATGDQLARIAASEAWDCIRQGGRAMLWAPGLAASEPAVSRNLWALLDWLARYPGAPGDDAAPAVSEAVMIVASSDAAVVDAIELARRRGAAVRGWVVGDADVDVDAPLRRAGISWPL